VQPATLTRSRKRPRVGLVFFLAKRDERKGGEEIVKRILTVLVVALVMAAMLVVMAAPAFAAVRHAGNNTFIYHGPTAQGHADKKIHH
jgi:hypothetical protein